MLTVKIDEISSEKRLDLFLAEINPDLSRSKIQNYIKNGYVTVNDKPQKPSYTTKEGDKIVFDMPKNEITEIKPENVPLNIVYEDENMLVVNKPSGMLTHPTAKEISGTLVNALLYKYGNNLSDINGDFRRGILHRLDRNTSGLLMVAKNNKTHEFLAEQIKNHEVIKKYRAILNGNYKEDKETINLPIARNPKNPQKMMVSPDGKESTTILEVKERFKEATVVELTLVTGRTHQIRVHTSYKKHPIYNDTIYGGTGKVLTDEQVLQSFYLKFKKPFTQEFVEIEIPPDEKFNKVYNYLKNRRN
ncbi:RluA family pseudouridine synthase [bacterium]|nr:RluA family pseudouridine synthase [bacterium]